MGASKTMRVRIPVTLRDRIRCLADARGVDLEYIVAQALDALEQELHFDDAATGRGGG